MVKGQDQLIDNEKPDYGTIRNRANAGFAKIAEYIELASNATNSVVLQHFADNIPQLWEQLIERYPFLDPNTFDADQVDPATFPIVMLSRPAGKTLSIFPDYGMANFTGPEIKRVFHKTREGPGVMHYWGKLQFNLLVLT